MPNANLDSAQRAELSRRLLDRRQALTRQMDLHQQGLGRVEHAQQVLSQDADDAPQRDADREVDLALSDRDAVELAAIERALTRLAQGRYGACERCGGAIAFARLQLEPHAERCVACESALETSSQRRAAI